MPELGLGQPIPDDPTDPVGGDFAPDMTDEQVEDALGRKPGTQQATDEPEPSPEPPEEEPAPIEDEPKPLTSEERMAALESEVRVERLEREKAEAIAERERYLHSRNAGELGYLKRMLAERKTEDNYVPPADPEGSGQALDEIRGEINSLKAERTQQGIAEELSNFQRAYPDAVTDEQALTEVVQRKLPDYREFLDGNDPKLARTMVRSLLKESYAELRIERERSATAAAVTTSYDQADKLKARKIAAAPVTSTRTATQRARPKSIDDLSDAELESLTDAYVRENS